MLALSSVACASQVRYDPQPVDERAPRDIVASMYLVGDAGLVSDGQRAVLAHLRQDLARHGERTPAARRLVLFLGDNVYEVGAREARRDEDLAKLAPQVEVTRAAPGTRAVFLPGNHDWAHGADLESARRAVRLQQRWLDELAGDSSAVLLPADACPGPEAIDLVPGVSVIVMDTEWLLRGPADSCGGTDRFHARLAEMLAERAGGRVVLAAHHPMATGGTHGGNVSGLDGGPFVKYLAIKAGLSVQDLASGRYSSMLLRLRAAIDASGVVPLAFASGHDHSLQVIGLREPGEPAWQLVSGSAAKSSPARRIDGTRYATDAHGYMRLDFGTEWTRLTVFAWDGHSGTTSPVFACTLTLESEEPGACPEARLSGDQR